MILELEDILERVAATENERSGYNKMADAWEAMWNLEAFEETREAALKDNREQVILPEPYNVVNLAQRLFPAIPKIEVPTEDITISNEGDAEARKRFLMGLWQRSGRDQGTNLLGDAVWQGLVLGRFCFDVRWVKDELPKRIRKRRCPIFIRTLDPRNVGVKHGPLFTLYAYHKYKEDRASAMTRYPDLEWEEDYKGITGQYDDVEIVDFWYTSPADGTIYNAIIVDNQFAEEPYETDYIDIPIIEYGCDSAPTHDEARKAHGILHALNGTWQYQCRLASQQATGLLWYFWPAILTRSKTGQAPPDIDIGPGITTPLPDDIEVDLLQFPVNVPMADQMMNLIQTVNQQSTFPGVMYGQAPGQIQAGFAVSILADAASGRINSLRQNLELAMQTVNEISLGLVEEMGGSEGVPVWGRNEAEDSIQSIVLTGDQVSGYYENIVSLKPQIPNDEFQRQTVGLQLVQQGIISRETFRKKYADIDLPSNEEKRVLWEQAAFTDGSPISEFLRDMAVEEKLELPDWKVRMMEYQATEQMDMEEVQRKIEEEKMKRARPPATPPGMPPGGPPPGMMPQGPPPGMMPPGMPPQGPPPGGESLQLAQGAPLSSLPPEMQGQVTPEMLGIPPGAPPELFQMAMNQFAPPGATPTLDDIREGGP